MTKPFIANLPVLQSLLVQHFMDLTLNTGVSDLELGAVPPKKQMERHKSSRISVASSCNSRLHFRDTNIARSTNFENSLTQRYLITVVMQIIWFAKYLTHW